MRLYPWLKWSLVALLFLVLEAGQTWATYRLFTSRSPGGNDFHTRWANGCALMWTGENPYSDDVVRQARISLHGRSARTGDKLAAFSYPIYALSLLWSLCLNRSSPLVQATWMTLMSHVPLAGIVCMPRVARWWPPAWLRGVTLILGQMAAAVFLATLQSSRETSTVYLPFPVLMLVVQVPG